MAACRGMGPRRRGQYRKAGDIGLYALGIGAIASAPAAAQNGWGTRVKEEHAMIEKTQIELAKTLWDQARAAALQAHDGWDMVMKAQKTWMDSMRGTGPAFEMAADQYDKLMDFHSKQYKAPSTT
jgi:hypothetical protein